MHLDKILTQEFLEDQFIVKKREKTTVSREIGCTVHSINKYIKKYNLKIDKLMNESSLKLIDTKVNGITILNIEKNDRFGKVRLKCKCFCGKEFTCNKSSIIRNLTKSCGCLKSSKLRKNGYEDVSSQYMRRLEIGARKRGKTFNITPQDIWEVFVAQNKKCALSNLDLSFSPDYNHPERQTASVDRKDNSKGYEKDNIQIVHKTVNVCKMFLNQDEFIAMCNLTAKNHNKELSECVEIFKSQDLMVKVKEGL